MISAPPPPPSVDHRDNHAPAPPRRIVQIACADGALYALASDGTIWSNWGSGQAWARVDTTAITGAA